MSRLSFWGKPRRLPGLELTVPLTLSDGGAIADSIDWFKNRPEKVREMGQKARLKAENYTWERARGGIIDELRALQSKERN